MPSLRLYLSTGISPEGGESIKDSVRQGFAQLPSTLRRDAVLAIIECEVVHGEDADPYWLEVRCSKEDHEGVVLQIANYFIEVVDVEAYHPQTGALKFKLRGTGPFVGF